MIFSKRKITIAGDKASIDKPIVLYRGDREIEIQFEIVYEVIRYRMSNTIEEVNASFGQLIIQNDSAPTPTITDVSPTNEGVVIFKFTKEMIDEISEIGAYSFQIRLFDDTQTSRITTPIIENGITIKEPLSIYEGDSKGGSAEVGVALTGTARVQQEEHLEPFDEAGNYNETTWATGDIITSGKLNKLEDGITGVNQKVKGITVANGITIADTAGNFTATNVEGALAEVGSQIKEIVGKKICQFDSIASMKSYNLKEGQVCETLGYYQPNDGGNAKYYIVNDSTLTDDGGSVHDLANGLKAKLIVENNTIKVNCFGAKHDYNNSNKTGTDDTECIQKAINFAQVGQTLEFTSNQAYLISKTLKIPHRIPVNGNLCFIFMSDNFDETDGGFAFYYGHLEPNGNPIYDTNIIGNEFKNFTIQHYGNIPNKYFNGIFVGGHANVKNIYTWGLNKTVEVTEDYIDYIKVQDINIYGKYGTDYAIYTGYIGDAREVRNIHLYKENHIDPGHMKTLKVGSGHYNCLVENIINGDIELTGGSVNLRNIHLEEGRLIINNCQCEVANIYVRKKTGYYPIAIASPNKNKDRSRVILKNMLVSYYYTDDYTNDNFIDISLDTDCILEITNCFKAYMYNSIGTKFLSGINVKNLSEFNDNSVYNSIQSSIYNHKLHKEITIIDDALDNTQNLLGLCYTSPVAKWNETSGTYYYTAIRLYDSVRMVGQAPNNFETSGTVTNAENACLIKYERYGYSNIRLYRGTSTGVYDKYADFGVNANSIIDTGKHVQCNAWVDRTAGGIDTILQATYFKLNTDGKAIVRAMACPTVGYWQKGDIILNSDYASNNVYGWVCTKRGTPGTWKVISSLT